MEYHKMFSLICLAISCLIQTGATFSHTRANSNYCDIQKWLDFMESSAADLPLSKTSRLMLEDKDKLRNGIKCTVLRLIHFEVNRRHKKFKKRDFLFDEDQGRERGDEKSTSERDEESDPDGKEEHTGHNTPSSPPDDDTESDEEVESSTSETRKTDNEKPKETVTHQQSSSQRRYFTGIPNCFCSASGNASTSDIKEFFFCPQSQKVNQTEATLDIVFVKNDTHVRNDSTKSKIERTVIEDPCLLCRVACSYKHTTPKFCTIFSVFSFNKTQRTTSNFTYGSHSFKNCAHWHLIINQSHRANYSSGDITSKICAYLSLLPLLATRNNVSINSSQKTAADGNTSDILIEQKKDVHVDKKNQAHGEFSINDFLTDHVLEILRKKLKQDENFHKVLTMINELKLKVTQYQNITEELVRILKTQMVTQIANLSQNQVVLSRDLFNFKQQTQRELKKMNAKILRNQRSQISLRQQLVAMEKSVQEVKSSMTVGKKENQRILDSTTEYRIGFQQSLDSLENNFQKQEGKIVEITEKLQSVQKDVQAKLKELNLNSDKNRLPSQGLEQEVEKKKYYRSCYDAYRQRQWDNKFEVITLNTSIRAANGIKVLCDFEHHGWTTILRRMDGSVEFFRPWLEYEEGFGDLTGEHWIGLRMLSELTESRQQKLWVEMEDWEGTRKSVFYSDFRVLNQSYAFQLLIDGFHGDTEAGDSLSSHNGSKFSTFDVDNDKVQKKFNGSCANRFHGGFWYFSCYRANPTGKYYLSSHIPNKQHDGIVWKTWRGASYALRSLVMKVRDSSPGMPPDFI